MIDGRWGGIREGLEEQTMQMAKDAKKLIEENVFYADGAPAEVVISPCTIGGGDFPRRFFRAQQPVLLSAFHAANGVSGGCFLAFPFRKGVGRLCCPTDEDYATCVTLSCRRSIFRPARSLPVIPSSSAAQFARRCVAEGSLCQYRPLLCHFDRA